MLHSIYITGHNFPLPECNECVTQQWLSENKVTWVLNWYPVSERFGVTDIKVA